MKVIDVKRSMLENLNLIVSGPPKMVKIGDTGLIAIVNREGCLRGMKPTGCLCIRPIQNDVLYGTIFIFRNVAGAFAEVKSEDIALIRRIFIPVLNKL